MAMVRQLWSISALAVELQRDRRTVAKQLANVPADGGLAGSPAWHLTTALTAMQLGGRPAGHLDPDQERAQKDRAQREAAEFKLAVARGEMVRVEDVGAQIEREYAVIRTRLLAISGKLGSELTAAHVALVEAEVREALEELHDPGDADIGGGEPDGSDEAGKEDSSTSA